MRAQIRVGIMVRPGLGEQLSGRGVHVHRDVLDATDAAVIVHQTMRLDDHGSVVPAIGDEELASSLLGHGVEIPGICRVDGEGLLAHHVRACLESGPGLLMVQPRRAGHDHDVRPGGDDLMPVGRGVLEAIGLLDAAQQLGVSAVHDEKVDVAGIAPSHQVRQVRAHGPGTRTDHADPWPRHSRTSSLVSG